MRVEVTLAKYTYTLEEVPRGSELVGGCCGCFFCRRNRIGHYVQTCYRASGYKGLTNRCYHNKTIYRAIDKRLKE